MDFSAPSFSLGFDWDDDEPASPAGGDRHEQPRGNVAPDVPSFNDVEEPRIPAEGRRKEHARGSTAPDPPSFSLGFDDEDDDGADQRREQARPQVASGVERDTLEAGPLPPPAETNRFKRLRKGPEAAHPAPTPQMPHCEAPDPPSFSLGFGDEDDDGADQRREQARPQVVSGVERDTLETGPLPPPAETKRLRKGPDAAHPASAPQMPHCVAPDPPSFSLNISDDDGDDDDFHEQPKPQAAPRAPSSLSFEDEDDDFFLTGDRQPEPTVSEVTQLKRLRKGPAPPHPAPSPRLKVSEPPTVEASPLTSENAARGAVEIGSWEDEIEDWTTDEDLPLRGVPPSVGSCSTSSNSKCSLLNRGVLMNQSATKANASKFTQTPNNSASISLEESSTKKLLPKITVSPMRKIHLLDSDTDADDDHSQHKAKALQRNRKPQMNSTVQNNRAMMHDNWATPALDEFCNEYFKSPKDAGFSQQKEGSTHYKVSQPKYSAHFQQQTSSSGAELDDGPPAMRYLFHPDPRVGNLFQNRLQHFIPIGAGITRENGQNRAESLSGSRRQFSSNAAANDDWVTPGRISVPTDASKRRVHAGGTHSGSGHWFTNESGRKIYVSKNGQELTGRDAYRQYQRESGRGRYKKKGSSGTKRGAGKVKTETAAKRGTGRAKRKR